MRISPAPVRLLRHLTRLSLAAMVLLLAASCHSTQVAYQFRPATSPAAATMASTDSVQVVAPVVATAATPAVLAAVPAKAARPALRPARQMRQLRRVVAQALAQQRVKPTTHYGAAQSIRHVARRPHQTAEVGLGTTVFGVLGLIVLPISLLGLLIWGGPVWAILAGLAALAILIAYLDPFG
ncbi:hypothetical protein J0X19_17150 [Hymenobacter sp. BT186]|uniref:Uncharacterized protein n=1 Tax=Hymenobacter telluris TaxID=2816474 RepID=A0A939EZ02_9BACT|nr:hypothetical protein [Hymenobacter telluris]MBO0359691.1 hypothetical protein [Hymenobacter telluris]MBW3375718.1 hypothetical protein [Hymenobacter norwichensis]